MCISVYLYLCVIVCVCVCVYVCACVYVCVCMYMHVNEQSPKQQKKFVVKTTEHDWKSFHLLQCRALDLLYASSLQCLMTQDSSKNTGIHPFIHTLSFSGMKKSVQEYVCVCVCECARARMCVCVRAHKCVCVCANMCMCKRVCVCAHVPTCAWDSAYLCLSANMHLHLSIGLHNSYLYTHYRLPNDTEEIVYFSIYT